MTHPETPDEQRSWLNDDANLAANDGTEVGPATRPHGDPLWRVASADATTTPTIEPFPWPPPEDGAIVPAFVRTWQGATLQPTRFFRALPDRLTVGSALLYYLPLGVLIAGADLFWDTVVQPVANQDAVLTTVTGAERTIEPLTWFLLSPVILLLSLFISAAVTHVLLRLFGGATRSLGSTTAVFAFGYSPMLFGVVPVIGTLLGFVWVIVITIIGLREVHGTTTGRAAAAVLIPVIVAVMMLTIVMLFATAGSLLDVPL